MIWSQLVNKKHPTLNLGSSCEQRNWKQLPRRLRSYPVELSRETLRNTCPVHFWKVIPSPSFAWMQRAECRHGRACSCTRRQGTCKVGCCQPLPIMLLQILSEK